MTVRTPKTNDGRKHPKPNGASLKKKAPEGIQHDDIGYFILHSCPIAIYRTSLDPDGKTLFANPAMVRMFGYKDHDSFLATSVRTMYVDPEERDALIRELLSQGKIEKKVVEFRKQNGDRFWGAVTGRVIPDESGRPLYHDGAIEDVTETQTYVQRLVEEKCFSDGVIEAMPGLFWLNDENGKPLRWNKNVEAVYGYSPDELPNLHALKDIVTPETVQNLLDAAERALKGGSGYCEYEIVTKSGKKIAFAGDARLVTINGKKYLASVEFDITKRKQAEEKLKEALVEIKRLKAQTEAENVYLMDEIERQSEYKNVVGKSQIFQNVLATAKKVAPTNATTLLLGETGTGKGVLAQLIHSLSPRHKRPLIKVNCANLPSTLIESILFGHEKGAFTSANAMRVGRFELANGSSIFLDEIAELPLELQSKLLRVIEDGEFERLGGSKTIRVDTRIIAATNRDLEAEVEAGRFRQDLLFRLNVYPIICPPLRERRGDIALLTHYFVSKFNKSFGKSVSKISNKTMRSLEAYPWPGNIRELQNVIERAMINCNGRHLTLSGFSIATETSPRKKASVKSLREVECDHIMAVLEETDWCIEGANGAARLLGLNPSTLRGRMRKYGIRRPGVIPQF